MKPTVPIRALVFDLYGTLLHLRDLSFQRLAPRLVGAGRREWVEFLREDLLVRSYPDCEALVTEIARRFARAEPDAVRAALLELLDRELAAVEPEPSLGALLGFFHRRGLRMAVLTNSASVYRDPFDRLVPAEIFDVVAFSSELGARKPQEESYRRVLAELGVEPAEAAMIGDSLPNDVEGPAALGLAPLLVGRSSVHPAVERFSDLAWLTGFERGELNTLLPPYQRVTLGDLSGTIVAVDLLPDSRQGRYNLVAEARVAWDAGFKEKIFVKRYRHPEAIRVEQCTRALLAEVGIDTNRVAVLEGDEPLLVAREVTGSPLRSGPPTPALAHEIGRHGASAYLFANADFRPRNAFLSEISGRPRLTMVDYEYALFDRVLDLADVPERWDPRVLARIEEGELRARGDRRVLTRATMKRARREFFDSRAVGAEVIDAFRAGWREVHLAAKAAAPRIEALLRERLEQDPPLLVGTEAHRRAFLPLDVADLLERIAADPAESCDRGF